jgi:predicted component of viral defense system (DUF524 family)
MINNQVDINLDLIQKGLKLTISAKKENSLFDAEESYIENLEARYQLLEGHFYDFEFSDSDYSFSTHEVIQPHSRHSCLGVISPNIYVGTLNLTITKKDKGETGTLQLEVCSIKTDYRTDYRDMLAEITEKCTELLMQANSPVNHFFEPDHYKSSATDYQRFSFIKSVIDTEEFHEAVQRIISAPVTKWVENLEITDIRKVKKFKNESIRLLVKGKNRILVEEGHYLNAYGLDSVPEKIMLSKKTDSIDTPENRFIKHALEVFLFFCSDLNRKSKKESRLFKESLPLIKNLENYLNQNIFKEISNPQTLAINSPVLQRKEGYREILKIWLMFDLASKLIWKGGENVYAAGKKDIATLYEYWIFFKLLEVIESVFSIKAKNINELIEKENEGLNIRLKQGIHLNALDGVYSSEGRKLNIKFNYNRSFNGKQKYPDGGSWTIGMRPDYTLSIWPYGVDDTVAEIEELIVHIHFDAKYKVAGLDRIFDAAEDENEKTEERKGVYKNGDLLKMHAYKDAIRRTGGAYVLYPGNKELREEGFHEIIPGLGAFAINPQKNDVSELKKFLNEVIKHFLNRTSQREKLAYRVYDIHQIKENKTFEEQLPEAFGSNRGLLPDDTYVLVGYYRNKEQFNWIEKENKYNFRMGGDNGALQLDSKTIGVKYLLLHTDKEQFINLNYLRKIEGNGPSVFSKKELAEITSKYNYSPNHEFYLVYKLAEPEPEFSKYIWDIEGIIKKYSANKYRPFTISLSDLMEYKKVLY